MKVNGIELHNIRIEDMTIQQLKITIAECQVQIREKENNMCANCGYFLGKNSIGVCLTCLDRI